jgi:energy-coupling factor transporter ATP-binding protein EcfA2
VRISSARFQNFKRFTDLTIEGIDPSVKLVVVIGANGSGKSSIFDGFEFLSRQARRGNFLPTSEYFRKSDGDVSVEVTTSQGVTLQRINDASPGAPQAQRFYGRSSNRIVPEVATPAARSVDVETDTDSPVRYILNDERFNADVQMYSLEIVQALTGPVFQGRDVNAKDVFEQEVRPLNESLERIFGTETSTAIQISRMDPAEVGKLPNLYFRKGVSEVSYDLLSHGEKQVVVLLLNFHVRREHLRNRVLFIDEMDTHLHRSLQYSVLREVTERWIPEDSQLWTTTHALGFIEFAQDAQHTAIIDLDALDLDVPQVVAPSDRTSASVFDIAVTPDLVAALGARSGLVLVEGTDAAAFNAALLPDRVFAGGRFNKTDVIHRLSQWREPKPHALIDRDFLTDREVKLLREINPTLRVLPSYCLENELYHPDNVAEAAKDAGLSRSLRAEWTAEKRQAQHGVTAKVHDARRRYVQPLLVTSSNLSRTEFETGSAEIVEKLSSDDFDTFFQFFSAKDHGVSFRNPSHLTPEQLANTEWFRQRLRAALA